MKVEQIYELVNGIATEVTGKEDLVERDLSNVVDVGKEIFEATDVDSYVRTLVNHIGKVIFVNRRYTGRAPSVLMDSWEFGSVLEKIQAEIPKATATMDWELQDGESYDPNIFYQPKVSAKFFNHKVSFSINMSFTELQVKQSFSSAEQLGGFISMLTTQVDNAFTINLDGLIQSTIAHMVGLTVNEVYGDGSGVVEIPTDVTHPQAVNLLYLYNQKYPNATLTAKEAVEHPEFIRFAAYIMRLYKDKLATANTNFNSGGKVRFTSGDDLHVVLLSAFTAAADVYLQSDTFHKELVSLPNAETVAYWQAPGKDYEFESISKINVKSKDFKVEMDGVLGIMFDRQALGVLNPDRRVTTNYNPAAEFYTNFYKADSHYFNDPDENFVVFYVK